MHILQLRSNEATLGLLAQTINKCLFNLFSARFLLFCAFPQNRAPKSLSGISARRWSCASQRKYELGKLHLGRVLVLLAMSSWSGESTVYMN